MKHCLALFFLALLLASPVQAQKMISHPWAGKRVGYIGDSITDPNNKGSKKKWWNYLSEWLDITPYTYAKSGRRWDDVDRQVDSLQNACGDNIDAFIIFLGTNDFNAGVPIGEWWNETEERTLAAVHRPKAMELRKRRTPNLDKSTFRGRINASISSLKRRYPTKQIVILTPIHRAYFYGGEQNIQPTEEYQNVIGEYFSTYVDCVREAGRIWSVPVVDLYALSGLYPVMDEGAVYFHNADNDRLHPNDLGHIRLARTLMYQLLALPCTF